MDWSLYRCGRNGHVTYAPEESHLRDHMHARTASAELWQCLRCGAYVSGQPHRTGPAAKAPVVRRGKQIRGDLILRLFAIERGIRVLLFGVVAYGIWRFANSRLTLTQAINRDVPVVRSLLRQLGFSINQSLVTKLQSVLHLSSTKLTLLAGAVTALAVVSGIEAFALWQAKRWGEYFAMIVTSLGLPLEVIELFKAITATKVTLFVLNLILVVYLIVSRRLLGVRGGKKAYEARLHADSVIDEAAKTAAARAQGAAAAQAPVGTASTADTVVRGVAEGQAPGTTQVFPTA